jgi:hypothetical protein
MNSSNIDLEEFKFLKDYHSYLDKIIEVAKHDNRGVISFNWLVNNLSLKDYQIKRCLHFLSSNNYIQPSKGKYPFSFSSLQNKGRDLKPNHFTNKYQSQLKTIEKQQVKEKRQEELFNLQLTKIKEDLANTKSLVKFWKTSSKRNQIQIYFLFGLNVLYILFQVLTHFKII